MTKIERLILNTHFMKALIHWSQHVRPFGFQNVPLYDVVVFFIKQMRKVGLNERAAAISFNFLMAIPAGTIFLCTLLPYLPVSAQITDELLSLTENITPNNDTYYAVKGFLEDFLQTPRSGLLSFGFLLAVFYASNAMMGIMRTFNKSLIYMSRRNFLESRWMAIKLTTVLILLIIATMFLLATQGRILTWLLELMHIENDITVAVIQVVRWVVLIALFYFAIAIIYKYAPSVHKRWGLISPGTILATLLLLVTAWLFSFWVTSFGNFNKVYGSIGTILIIMLLVYINSLVLLIGFELNVSIHSLRHQADERAKQETDGKTVH
ncbi:MAG TPA: YihY/virulence factor BrkB family protein [Chitinophagaceae bacterium]|nr:YihY/virulence factor BrkB family protein [Chitinophagaceae bacterium]